MAHKMTRAVGPRSFQESWLRSPLTWIQLESQLLILLGLAGHERGAPEFNLKTRYSDASEGLVRAIRERLAS
jgi:hypothetical protein